MSHRTGYSVKVAPIAAVLVALVAPLSTVIAVAAFGGSHPGPMEAMVTGLRKADADLISASFWPRFGLEPVDKTATAIIALGILALLPVAMKRHRVETDVTELDDVAA